MIGVLMRERKIDPAQLLSQRRAIEMVIYRQS